ncbi:MAG: hypothetical protein ABJN34_01145 [Litoreibacter sp.]|uniref:hypothetical protein n=1 Tax=Litoreibacter sp. TaxID=1969459 RepID=UPI0032978CEF
MQRRDTIARRTAAYVSLGQQRYRVEHIADPALAGISDVATLGDKIIVLRRQSPQLIVLGPNGTSLETCVELPQLVCGHGLRKIGCDRLAVTDMDGHKVIVIDGTLNEVTRMDCNDHPQLGRPFNHPCDCVQGPDGRFYVADGYGNSTVHIFSANLEHLRTFGEPGSGKGAFSTPHSLLFDAKGRLCVADRENDRVQIFDPDGNWLSQINGVHRPMALALTIEGLLLVTDQTPRLSAYDTEGNLVGRCRTFSTYGHGLAQLPDETIIIADMAPDRLTLLKPVAAALDI